MAFTFSHPPTLFWFFPLSVHFRVFALFRSFHLIFLNWRPFSTCDDVSYGSYREYHFSDSNSHYFLAFFALNEGLFFCLFNLVDKKGQYETVTPQIFSRDRSPEKNQNPKPTVFITLKIKEDRVVARLYKIDQMFLAALMTSSKKLHFLNFCHALDHLLTLWKEMEKVVDENNQIIWDNVRGMLNSDLWMSKRRQCWPQFRDQHQNIVTFFLQHSLTQHFPLLTTYMCQYINSSFTRSVAFQVSFYLVFFLIFIRL